LSGSTNKKVLVTRFDRESVAGYVNPQSFLQAEGVEVLTTAGSVARLPYTDVKAVCFVKDFAGPEAGPERRVFATRPKSEGLWVRMKFRDGEEMDGLLANNLLHLERHGFMVTPPDASSRNQRLFVPRAALLEFLVLGVVGSPLRRLARRKPAPQEGQIKLFE